MFCNNILETVIQGDKTKNAHCALKAAAEYSATLSSTVNAAVTGFAITMPKAVTTAAKAVVQQSVK